MEMYDFLHQLNSELGLEEAAAKKEPSKGMTAKEKGAAVKKAKKGEDLGKPGKKFKEIASKAGKKYGSKEAGKRVAGAVFWKKAKAGKL